MYTRTYHLDNERTWHVISGGLGIMGPSVVVPITQCDGLSDEQIGAKVRELFLSAQELNVEEEAEYLEGQSKISEEEAKEFLSKAWPYEANSESIKKVCERLRGDLEKYAKRRIAQSKIKEFRKAIASHYAEIFVRIGRRDGFYCQECGSSNELTIDHKTALVNGGTNNDENLQLLCKTCNSRKGDRL